MSIGQYFYDGDGKRVKKYIPTTGEQTIFVYDASGKMVAEYSTTVASQSTAQVSYLTSDHLGSPRINTDANGAVTARHDYEPFGEEIYAITGNTARTGYSTDAVRQKFTGYERETETPDLDLAQARMYANKLGRFTSTDPIFFQQSMMIEPQGFNLYSYVKNNPLKFIDPSGMIYRISARGNVEQAMDDVRTQAGEYAEFLVFDPVKDKNGTILYYNVSFNVTADDIAGNAGAQLVFDLVNDTHTFLAQRGGIVQGKVKNGKDKGKIVDLDVNQEGSGNITRNRPGLSGLYEPVDSDVDSIIYYADNVVFESNISGEDVQPIRLFIHEAAESFLLAKGIDYATAHGHYWKIEGSGKKATVTEYPRDPRNAISREKEIAAQLNLQGGFAGWMRVSNYVDLVRKKK